MSESYNPDPMSASRRRFANRVALATAYKQRARALRAQADKVEGHRPKAANTLRRQAASLDHKSDQLVKD